MNPFARLQNDTVYIENSLGARTGPYKTALASKGGWSASIFEKSLNVEEGWKLIRPLPNDKEEAYTILEVNYSPGLQAIPPNWTLKLQKDSAAVRPRPNEGTTINISHSQGIQVGDHNTQHIASSLIGLVEKIQTANVSIEEKSAAKGLIRDVLENPVVAAVLGGAAASVAALLG
jgi:hypothetical protein